ncbi:hypothetical protein ARAM_000509 [Aspergillus rambellii]|uniref:DNA repair protein n=1 Tax=Aspergillus rambellii TaxID=308745 RepID=A0A0F8UAS1_9EURO|nr:hypothetical protein ARAM_000509 [Aspergillus rambellii]
MPVPSRKGSVPSTPARLSNGAKPRSTTNRNTSLLNFFQKADGPPKSTSRQSRITQFTTQGERPNQGSTTPRPRVVRREDSSASNGVGGLFLGASRSPMNGDTSTTGGAETRERSRTPDDIWGEESESLRPEKEEQVEQEQARFHENGSAVKRRKLDSPSVEGADPKLAKKRAAKSPKASGPFIDESDSENELDAFKEFQEQSVELDSKEDCSRIEDDRIEITRISTADVPPLVREATSHMQDDECSNFDDPGEEEFQEQECSLDALDGEVMTEEGTLDFDANDSPALDEDSVDLGDDAPVCPVCQGSLGGLSEPDITTHVNDCLDGVPSIIGRKTNVNVSEKNPTRVELAAVPRPAQKDPLVSGGAPAASAFSKIMAGNAEDTAWAAAAASDAASRGKQAYQRTCPFYKIVTGFSVSVDAFRYGSVEGCKAYFLSHFHSDHYIGLSKSWSHGPIYCSKPTGNLVRQQLKVDPKWIVDLEFEKRAEVPGTGGVEVTMIEANHCPGSALFLFEKVIGFRSSKKVQRVLHCGDFRASPQHVRHSLLRPDPIDPGTSQKRQQRIDVCYLDTTYLSPKYAFPKQADVINACAELCVHFDQGDYDALSQIPGPSTKSSYISKTPLSRFLSSSAGAPRPTEDSRPKGRLLVVIGTYSIGKERICLAIARALKSKIYATAAKQRVCACLEDPELSSLLTSNPRDAQVHMQTLFEIRTETLTEYLDSLRPHFTRVVGFRPTGWTYRPPAGRALENPSVSTVLHSTHWKTPFSARDLTPQRGSTRESACFGVPYSEHSSFRELTMFCCALRIGRIIPTVNVGSQKSRERMKTWFERWEAEKRKSGLYKVEGDDW